MVKSRKTHIKTSNHSMRNTHVNKPICSPIAANNNRDTCYSDEALVKLKDLWNHRHPDSLIETDNPIQIWNILRTQFDGVCSTEKCWLRQQFASNKVGGEILDFSFAPESPKSWSKNPNEWLNSTDIHSVMIQYETRYPQFLFIGPTPIDFDTLVSNNVCVWDDLCTFDLAKMISKRKRKIGIIFNTDPHTSPGEHWVSMFIDLTAKPNPYIFYFDSGGEKVEPEIKALVDRIILQGKKIGMTIDFYQNHPKVHQKGLTECGMYALYMIKELLSDNKNYKYFIDHSVADKDIEKLRIIYYNAPE